MSFIVGPGCDRQGPETEPAVPAVGARSDSESLEMVVKPPSVQLDAISDPHLRNEEIKRILDDFTKEGEVVSALAFLLENLSLSREEDEWAFEYFAAQLLKTGKFQEAMAVWEQLPEGRLRRAIGARLSFDMAKADPRSAVKWIHQIPENEKVRAMGSVLLQLNEISEVEELLSIATDDVIKDELLQFLVNSQIMKDNFAESIKSAQQKAVELGREDKAKTLVKRGFYTWSYQDPASLAEYVNELPPGTDKETGIKIALQKWMAKDPPKAVEWASNLESEYRATAVNEAVHAWFDNDSEAASNWVAEQPADTRDPGVVAMIDSFISNETKDFDAALALVDVLSDSVTGDPKVAARIDAFRKQEEIHSGKALVVALTESLAEK
ncbi:MAG: hypothetical protein KDN22_00225 [Verrucomicrobiae bacterium]|nr:hypothetical protein [Verrucomicrobiae bacterium]